MNIFSLMKNDKNIPADLREVYLSKGESICFICLEVFTDLETHIEKDEEHRRHYKSIIEGVSTTCFCGGKLVKEEKILKCKKCVGEYET